MSLLKKWLLIFIVGMLLSCHSGIRNGEDLSHDEHSYLGKLGLLQENEDVIYFDSQGGFYGMKVSGNFFTNKRIASYWIDKKHNEQTQINSAFYRDVSSMKMYFIRALTYSSYITVKKNSGKKFKVYIDADSLRFTAFYKKAVTEWEKAKQ